MDETHVVPTYNIISRTAADELIPLDVAHDLITAATQESAALTLFRATEDQTTTGQRRALVNGSRGHI